MGEDYVQHPRSASSPRPSSRLPLRVIFVSTVTGLILLLAANTAFNGFPVLGSILASDGYLPRQLHTRGDRLAFSNGILMLAARRCARPRLRGRGHRADPALHRRRLRVVHASQIGMVRHWTRHLRSSGTATGAAGAALAVINAIGAACPATVLIVVLSRSSTHGARYAILAMGVLFPLMLGIRKHYDRVRDELAIDWDVDEPLLPSHVHAIVCVSRSTSRRCARWLRAGQPAVDARGRHRRRRPRRDPGAARRVGPARHPRAAQGPGLALPRDHPPILDYVRSIRRGHPRDLVTVYLPEYVLGKWWEQVLHNQSALRLKARLLFTPGVMVVSVPWQLASSEGAERDWIDEPPIRGSVRGRRTVSTSPHPRARRRAATLVGQRRPRGRTGRARRPLRRPARGPGRLRAARAPGRAGRRAGDRGRGSATASSAPMPSRCSTPRRTVAPPVPRMPRRAGAAGATSSTPRLETQRGAQGGRRPRAVLAASRSCDLDVDVHPVPGDVEGLAVAHPRRVRRRPGRAGRACVVTARTTSSPSTTASSPTPGVIDSGVLDTDWPDVEAVDVVDAAHPDEPVLVPLPAAGGRRGLVGERAHDGDWEGEYVVAARGFWQVHPGAASTFLGRVTALLGAGPGDSVLDLYAGSGLFTMRLGELVAPDGFVLGVEGDARAVDNGIPATPSTSRTSSGGTNRVDRELSSLVSQGVLGRPRRARPAPHRRRPDVMAQLAALGPAPRGLRRVRPGGAGARRQGCRRARLRPGVARGLGRLPDDPPRRVHRRARAHRGRIPRAGVSTPHVIGPSHGAATTRARGRMGRVGVD